MTIKLSPVVAASILLASIGPGTASAAELGTYAGFFYGNTDNDASGNGFDLIAQGIYRDLVYNPQPRSPGLDSKDNGYGFIVGYRLTSWLALEGGYIDFGDITFRDRTTGTIGEDQVQTELDLKISSNIAGIVLSALAVVPLSYRWETYGRVGFMLGSDELNISARGALDGSAEVSESSTDVLVGAGVSFSLAEIYSVRAEYMRVLKAGDKDLSGEGDIGFINLGLTVQF